MKTIYRTKDGVEFNDPKSAETHENNLFWEWLHSNQQMNGIVDALSTWNAQEEWTGSDRTVFVTILKSWFVNQQA